MTTCGSTVDARIQPRVGGARQESSDLGSSAKPSSRESDRELCHRSAALGSSAPADARQRAGPVATRPAV
eukprot:13359727-Alexandrium_andersonii.AAC.1